MGVIALVGDCTTTTALALCAAWPLRAGTGADVIVAELDASGGSLAAWLGTPSTPSLSTLVAAQPARPASDAGTAADIRSSLLRWSDVESIVQRSRSGIRFIAAPTRAREATRAIEQIETSLLRAVASESSPDVVCDLGRISPTVSLPLAVSTAAITLIVHRQDPASAGAASVRIERLIETLELVGSTGTEVMLAVIGDRPFGVEEIADHVASATDVPVTDAQAVAVDPLSATAFAGRAGVSSRRLARLPLVRSVTPLADRLEASCSRQIGMAG